MGPGLRRDDDGEISDSTVKQRKVCDRIPAAGFRPGFAISLSLSFKEGAGKAGRRLRPQSRVRECYRRCTRVELQVQPGHPGFPRAMVYGFLRALPGERPFLPPSPIDRSIGLTPGSRRQDHTTSPYAVSVFARAVCTALSPQRPSQPAPTFRDDRASVPFWRRGLRRVIDLICYSEKQNIFAWPSGQPKSA
jgi:hypothetical protein